MQSSLPSINLQQEDKNLKAWIIGQDVFPQKLKMQDVLAFKSLYKQYAASLYGSIIRTVTDEQKAETILQETFIEAWEFLPKYNESQCKMFTWLNRIAKQKSSLVKF